MFLEAATVEAASFTIVGSTSAKGGRGDRGWTTRMANDEGFLPLCPTRDVVYSGGGDPTAA